MQLLLRAFLAIYLAHLLTDLFFRRTASSSKNGGGIPPPILLHGLITISPRSSSTGFVLRGSILSLRTHLVIAALTLVHLLIDLGKIQLAKKYPSATDPGPTSAISSSFPHRHSCRMAAVACRAIQRTRRFNSKFPGRSE